MTDFRDLSRPFACNAVNLVTGEGVTLDAGYLPLAIRTCMSLPGAFRPVRADDGLFLDGGPDHMLPVPEAEALGADRERADLIIEPDVASLNTAGLGNPAPWIAEGRCVATAALPVVRALIADNGIAPVPVRPSPRRSASLGSRFAASRALRSSSPSGWNG